MAKRRQYTKTQKEQAAVEYALKGSFTQVGKALDIPHQTIESWAKDWEGWDDLISRVQDEKSKQHRANYVAIIDKAQRITLEKLDDCSAKDASVISGISFDKTRLIDNQPTSISSNTGDMKALVSKFQAMADTYKEKQVNVVQTIEKVKEP